MPNKRKCRHCGEYGKPEDMVIVPLGAFCDFSHASEYGIANKAKGKVKIERDQRRELRARKEKIKTRGAWYKDLQTEVNRWILIRDKDKPCFTCGKTDPSKQYHAGHRHHAGSGGGDRRRFVETNLNRQCAYCNTYNGGMPVEYDKELDRVYGKGTAEWLSCEDNFYTLKQQFPTTDDIKAEIARYRKLIRESKDL